ncbi:MAG: 5-dehydro-4-deoxy-D-glucuronate isomerase [Sedimentisphaerales bacterium]|nr:5-dehydro-4-deoxy-D-glucuronate isomerase [Sedimentisphaerales bacterium]
MEIRYLPDPNSFIKMDTDLLRRYFLIQDLFAMDQVRLVYCDCDRALVGGAVPVKAELTLESGDELRSEYLCQRRELGIFNVGGKGQVKVDGKTYVLDRLDCLYVGRSSRQIVLTSLDPKRPARFYLLSFPAHADYPTTLVTKPQAEAVSLGSQEHANRRTIYKYIHQAGVRSCQLVMGYTELEAGSVWNTMPPHTHARRMEVYMYFGISDQDRIFHLMGRPDQTRHLVVADCQAVLSPSWSIHSGVGTSAYCFCWGMGGENQAFDDMDGLRIEDLR